ncbi:MAG: Gfo/Idh/MocA family oxidoreductase [Proteobacteria bacterium]|nr:Gfo/Idh/MocA family oxidoreductase [Pseudomonadota bacterium]
MYNVGVIGCGYWGPNLIRNYTQLNRSRVKIVADLDRDRLSHMKKLYPSVETTIDYMNIINDPEINIVTIATPVSTHYKFASEALSAGKHVFVEKPIASSAKDAESLVNIAKKNHLKLMVGHTFIYTAAVKKMKEIVQSGELGDIYYINSQRLNLGLFQKDINVLWDLAPHDISIILYLLDQEPKWISAAGSSNINGFIEDVAVLTMKFNDKLIAFTQVSWLDPDKIRKMTVVGSKKMMVYDDVQPTEKIRIYDKAVEMPKHYDTFAEFQYSYKYGDIIIPKIDGKEPLSTELSHFLDCIEQDLTPMSSGEKGLEVVKILEASDESLKNNSSLVELCNNQFLLN